MCRNAEARRCPAVSVSSCLHAYLQEVFSRLDPDEMCEALEPGLLAVVGCLPDLKVVGVVSWPPTRGGDPTGRWCQRQDHRLQWADCSQLRAAELGYHKTVDVLLDKGADKYVVVDELGDKPLMVASARGCLSAVKTLIDLKVVGVVLPRNRVIPPFCVCLSMVFPCGREGYAAFVPYLRLDARLYECATGARCRAAFSFLASVVVEFVGGRTTTTRHVSECFLLRGRCHPNLLWSPTFAGSTWLPQMTQQ